MAVILSIDCTFPGERTSGHALNGNSQERVHSSEYCNFNLWWGWPSYITQGYLSFAEA